MRTDKTVFISYRRTNAPWALALFQNLTHHGFDVFFDYLGFASGNIDEALLENIRSRAHFLIVLTPSALARCGDPRDRLRREIEEAMESSRHIVPLMLERFDFGALGIASQLTGKLAALKSSHVHSQGVKTKLFLWSSQDLVETFPASSICCFKVLRTYAWGATIILAAVLPHEGMLPRLSCRCLSDSQLWRGLGRARAGCV